MDGEANILEQARAGDGDAFGHLVHAYHDRLTGLLMRYTRDPLLAQELEQQVWIKVWKSLPHFRESSSFFTWLYSIAVRTALDYFRKSKRRSEVEYMDEVEAPGSGGGRRQPDEEIMNTELRQQIDRAMKQLPEKLRIVLVLRELEGLSYSEIARILKCREGTVMSRLYNARQKMQLLLKGGNA
jgi:RNA polymerase sigma-70 factor (ECF subfamily)